MEEERASEGKTDREKRGGYVRGKKRDLERKRKKNKE